MAKELELSEALVCNGIPGGTLREPPTRRGGLRPLGLGDGGLVMAAAAAIEPGSGGRKKGSGTANMGGATGLPRRSPGSSVNGEPWKKAALLCEDVIDVRAPERAVPGMPAEVAEGLDQSGTSLTPH